MITRENYEEYFLSYVDNELPAETRLAVERFVAVHPDLREELETLQQCRLEPEPDAVFPDKNNLLQYEESLLLYVDGELDDVARKTVEELVSQEPRLASELERLKITVSQPEPSIVFPGKESLYHPVKRRRVIMMPWLQATAAAAIVAIAVLLLLPRGHKTLVPAAAVVKNNHAAVTPAVTSPLYAGRNAPETTARTTLSEKIKLPAPAVAQKAAGPAIGGRPEMLAVTHPSTASGKMHPVAASGKMHPATASNATHPATPSGMQPAPASNEVASTDPITASNLSTATNPTMPADPMTPARTGKTAAVSVAVVNIPKEQRSFATQALLGDAQQERDGDMADNMPPATGKTKLRGLFRRVTRAFGKTADRDDDGGRQVSISVFQVALK